MRNMAPLSCPATLRRFAGNLRLGGNIEVDFARHLEDTLWMVAILEKRVLYGLGPVHEHSAKSAVLFADNPVTTTISAHKDDDRSCRPARRRIDYLQSGIFSLRIGCAPQPTQSILHRSIGVPLT